METATSLVLSWMYWKHAVAALQRQLASRYWPRGLLQTIKNRRQDMRYLRYDSNLEPQKWKSRFITLPLHQHSPWYPTFISGAVLRYGPSQSTQYYTLKFCVNTLPGRSRYLLQICFNEGFMWLIQFTNKKDCSVISRFQTQNVCCVLGTSKNVGQIRVQDSEMLNETIQNCTVDTQGCYSSPCNLPTRIRTHDTQQLVITTASVFWSESSIK
jgi:hypothetical protein